MSDQASSQKAFNRMIKDKIEEETVHDGRSNSGELVETYCGMHVGVNLRAAEVKGINKYIAESKNFNRDRSHCTLSVQVAWSPGGKP